MGAISGCVSTSEESTSAISSSKFGNLPDGNEVSLYSISNGGVTIKFLNYGGIITSIETPDKSGQQGDIVLGYDHIEGYINQSPYFGAIIGRYGNRIKDGQFELDGTKYQLARNNIGNHLHGGREGFDKVLWNVETYTNNNVVGAHLTYVSKHMEEGYPGELSVKVTYELDLKKTLTVKYEATTSKATVINLTQHSYFNLKGVEGDILDHHLQINAKNMLPVDSTLIPTGVKQVVKGTPFDFTKSKLVGKDISSENKQLIFGKGYDHCWVLDGQNELKLAARLEEHGSGRFLEIYTTEPGIQFYSGNFLDGSITGKYGIKYEQRNGLCLETQHFPNSPNESDFPSTKLNPGEIYQSTTKFVFGVIK